MLPFKNPPPFIFYIEYINFICMFRRTLLFSSSRQKAVPWHYYSGLNLQFFFYFGLHFGLDGGLGFFVVRQGEKQSAWGRMLTQLPPALSTDRQTRSGPLHNGADSHLRRDACKGFAAAPPLLFNSNAIPQRAESATGASICFWEELEP